MNLAVIARVSESNLSGWGNVTTLERAFAVNSPRLTPRGPALSGWLIHIAVVALWVALFAQVFLQVGAGLWSVGIAYIAYDTILLAFVLWQTLPLRRLAPAVPTVRGPTLGVLIAAYDEAAVLPATLHALLAQTEPPEEIVVADDGSEDNMLAVVDAEFGDRYPSLRLLRLPHRGKASALNSALLAVGTDVVSRWMRTRCPRPMRSRPSATNLGQTPTWSWPAGCSHRCAARRFATAHSSGSRPTNISATSSPATLGCG